MNFEAQLHVFVAIAATITVLFVLKSRLKKSISKKTLGTVGLGVLLYTLGIYFFPLAALEAYDGTKAWFSLSDSGNAILWYILTTALIVGGILLMTLKQKGAK